jgi:hypothetical protein
MAVLEIYDYDHTVHGIHGSTNRSSSSSGGSSGGSNSTVMFPTNQFGFRLLLNGRPITHRVPGCRQQPLSTQSHLKPSLKPGLKPGLKPVAAEDMLCSMETLSNIVRTAREVGTCEAINKPTKVVKLGLASTMEAELSALETDAKFLMKPKHSAHGSGRGSGSGSVHSHSLPPARNISMSMALTMCFIASIISGVLTALVMWSNSRAVQQQWGPCCGSKAA